MTIPEYIIEDNHLSLGKFKEMDYRSIKYHHLTVELMMENAGLQLARLVAHLVPATAIVLIGIGPGNNGGGGLVAARRLSGWGFKVNLDIPVNNLNELSRIQLKRALSSGAILDTEGEPDAFVDAYLGFSQRIPLTEVFQKSGLNANQLKCPKLSLDIPTGFRKNSGVSEFIPDIVLTLAAMKTELTRLSPDIQLYLADLGIPGQIYHEFGIKLPLEFRDSGLLKCVSLV